MNQIRINKKYRTMTMQTLHDPTLTLIMLYTPSDYYYGEYCWVLAKNYDTPDRIALGIGLSTDHDKLLKDYPELKGYGPHPIGWIMGKFHDDGSVDIDLIFTKAEDVKE